LIPRARGPRGFYKLQPDAMVIKKVNDLLPGNEVHAEALEGLL
jgi:hypothetical protein